MRVGVLYLFLECSIQASFGGIDVTDRVLSKRLTSLVRNCTLVVFDDHHAEFISTITSVIEKRMTFTVSEVHTALVPVMENLMEHASLEQMRDQLQFLVVCELSFVQRLFAEIDNLDRVVGQGSLLRHFSTWMIVSSGGPPPTNSTLDNVVWISVSNTIGGIYTLIWMPGRREWSTVLGGNFDNVSVPDQLFPNINRGLNGRHIILATLQWTGYAIREVADGKLHYKGLGFDIVDNLETKFNFSYIIAEPEDSMWGQEVEEGNYTGVLGMLQRKEADLCPVPYSIAARRHFWMDFSSPVDASKQVLIYKKSPDKALSWLFLASSFSWSVYLCGAGSLLWVTLLVFLIHYSRSERHGEVFIRLVQYVSFHIPLRQDIQLVPKGMSSRIMLFTWSLFCLMFAAVYTSNLVAFITVDRNSSPFNTLEELAFNRDYKIVIMEGVYVETILKESNDSVLQTIYKRLVVLHTSANESFNDMENRLLNIVLSGNYVLLTTNTISNDLLSKTCELKAFRKQLFSRNNALVFPKNSPLKKYFDQQLLYMVDIGLIENFKKKWFSKAKPCRPEKKLPTFSLNHFKSGLIVVVGGIVSAGCVLLCEKIAFR